MKTRMTERLRDSLRAIVTREIVRHDLMEIVSDRYSSLAPLVRMIVEAKYPSNDMEILKRYKCHHVDDCVKLQLTHGGIDAFEFYTKTGPLVPAIYDCTRRIYEAGSEVTELFQFWKLATDNLSAGNQALWHDYYALILNARHLEQVIEIWPHAATLLKSTTPTAISVVTPELVERIRQDQEMRQNDPHQQE